MINSTLIVFAIWYSINGVFLAMFDKANISCMSFCSYALFWPAKLFLKTREKLNIIFNIFVYISSFSVAFYLIKSLGALIQWIGENDLFGIMK